MQMKSIGTTLTAAILVCGLGLWIEKAQAQETSDLFKIIATGCPAPSDVPTMASRSGTGFAVTGIDGIFTALHVVIGCATKGAVRQAAPTGQERELAGLEIARASVDLDVALLRKKDSPVSAAVLRHVAVQSDSTSDAKLRVFGFAGDNPTPFTEEMTLRLESGHFTWKDMPATERIPIDSRKSPSVDSDMLFLQGVLRHGTSGAPVLRADQPEVLGVALGGEPALTMQFAAPLSAALKQLDSYDEADQRVRDIIQFDATRIAEPMMALVKLPDDDPKLEAASWSDVVKLSNDPRARFVAAWEHTDRFRFGAHYDEAWATMRDIVRETADERYAQRVKAANIEQEDAYRDALRGVTEMEPLMMWPSAVALDKAKTFAIEFFPNNYARDVADKIKDHFRNLNDNLDNIFGETHEFIETDKADIRQEIYYKLRLSSSDTALYACVEEHVREMIEQNDDRNLDALILIVKMFGDEKIISSAQIQKIDDRDRQRGGDMCPGQLDAERMTAVRYEEFQQKYDSVIKGLGQGVPFEDIKSVLREGSDSVQFGKIYSWLADEEDRRFREAGQDVDRLRAYLYTFGRDSAHARKALRILDERSAWEWANSRDSLQAGFCFFAVQFPDSDKLADAMRQCQPKAVLDWAGLR
jgi:Trypsin-like peptidase domain